MEESVEVIRKFFKKDYTWAVELKQKLIDNGMFFYPEGTFWVRDTKSLFLGLRRRLQYYAPSTDLLTTAKSHDERHQRITVAYFYAVEGLSQENDEEERERAW